MNKLLSYLDFSKVNVLIAGDMMLDRYYYGSVSRISPEAPVPVINVKSEIYTLGGAGNVVNNIKGLTADCTIIGAGKKNDDAGRLLNNLFNNIVIDETCVYCGMCARFCNTGALYINDERTEITFNPSKCISCKLCERACYHNKLHYKDTLNLKTFFHDNVLPPYSN